MFLHCIPRYCLTGHIPCYWWAGAGGTSSQGQPLSRTTPNLQPPSRPKNPHQKDWNWQTRKDKASTEGSNPFQALHQWLKGIFLRRCLCFLLNWYDTFGMREDAVSDLHSSEPPPPRLTHSDQCTLKACVWVNLLVYAEWSLCVM